MLYKGRARDAHAPAPKRYEAKDLEEYDSFVDACELEFKKNPHLYPQDDRRIFYAAGHLGEAVRIKWRNFKEGRLTADFTWNQFLEILWRALRDEGNLWLSSNRDLGNAKLEPDKDVDAFVARLNRLH